MERLTKKMQGQDGKEKYVIKAEFLNNPSEFTRKLIDKLGEYEELEECSLQIARKTVSEVELVRIMELIEKETIEACIFLTPQEVVRWMKERVIKVFLGEAV